MVFVYTLALTIWYWLNLNCGPNNIDLSAPRLESWKTEWDSPRHFCSLYTPIYIYMYFPYIPRYSSPIFPFCLLFIQLLIVCDLEQQAKHVEQFHLTIFISFAALGPPAYVWFSWDIKKPPLPLSAFVPQQSLMTFTSGKLYVFIALFCCPLVSCLLLISICVNKFSFRGLRIWRIFDFTQKKKKIEIFHFFFLLPTLSTTQSNPYHQDNPLGA